MIRYAAGNSVAQRRRLLQARPASLTAGRREQAPAPSACAPGQGCLMRDSRTWVAECRRRLAALDGQPGSERAQADAHRALGRSLRDARQYEESLHAYQRALALYEALEKVVEGRAACTFGIAFALRELWQPEAAAEKYREAYRRMTGGELEPCG